MQIMSKRNLVDLFCKLASTGRSNAPLSIYPYICVTQNPVSVTSASVIISIENKESFVTLWLVIHRVAILLIDAKCNFHCPDFLPHLTFIIRAQTNLEICAEDQCPSGYLRATSNYWGIAFEQLPWNYLWTLHNKPWKQSLDHFGSIWTTDMSFLYLFFGPHRSLDNE
jgi:hypothetical protein